MRWVGSQDNAPILFMRYAYKGAIFEVEFHDNENVLLPSPNAKDTGESFRPVNNEAKQVVDTRRREAVARTTTFFGK